MATTQVKHADEIEPGDLIDTDAGEYYGRDGARMTGVHEVYENYKAGYDERWLYWVVRPDPGRWSSDRPRSPITRRTGATTHVVVNGEPDAPIHAD